jgi:hypothetical protein
MQYHHAGRVSVYHVTDIPRPNKAKSIALIIQVGFPMEAVSTNYLTAAEARAVADALIKSADDHDAELAKEKQA